MKLFKRILLVLVILLVIIQFIPCKLPQTNHDTKNDIIANGLVNDETANTIKASCYDCHSNQTHYPWYSRVAPVSWLLTSDVKEGRGELNFSEWNSYDKRRKIRKLGDIKEQVEKGDMPIPIYTLIHRNTKLNETQKALIMKWSDELATKLLQ